MPKLTDLTSSKNYESSFDTCSGCTNRCEVRKFVFDNGNTYYSGNNCEKVFSNSGASVRKGVNMFAEKYRRLFSPERIRHIDLSHPRLTIGLPRGLGMYENFPFWQVLLAHCNIRPVLSARSSNALYQKGLRSIMADNICFPAKLMHGHVVNLVERKVDRILYPYVVYERKEDDASGNSYNCPVVSGYSDVMRSSMETERRFGIPLDNPAVSFNDPELLRDACVDYLRTLGVSKSTAIQALAEAVRAQQEYLDWLEQRSLEILDTAKAENRMVIMLAARPYHIDPLIQHKVADAISDMGIDLICENAAAHAGSDVYGNINAISQWAYPNRIFKAAHFCAQNDYQNLHFVELTSFGCGPDAFILDEVENILRRGGKNLTLLKIDDVNNIGSLRLRIRSLVESVSTPAADSGQAAAESTPPPFGHIPLSRGGVSEPQKNSSASNSDSGPTTTKIFTAEDRQRTIIAPYFAEGYSEFLPALFKAAGYNLVCLPQGTQADAETGLKYANNEICYPATIVIGSIMNALNSGKYDLNDTAVIITQTGGQCRASNYYALIKNAMVGAGYAHVPLLSMALGSGVNAQQPGFTIDWKRMARILVHAIIYADCLNKLYFAAAPRESEKGAAKRLRQHYLDSAQPLVRQRDVKGLKALMAQAVKDFTAITQTKQVPQIGLVGEIYVKYNSFSHKNVVNWLVDEGVEVVPPAIYGYFMTTFVVKHINREMHVKRENTPLWITDLIHRYIRHVVRAYEKVCRPFPYFRPFSHIFQDAERASKIVNLAGDFGEGWGIPAEISHLAADGVDNVISLQPFGCIANHIISKGIEKRIKRLYPNLNLLFLDFDSSTSEANVYNRLHFMVQNAKNEINNDKMRA